MSTFNGFGTMYYGWRHAPDGTSTATKWLVALFLPILPVRRRRLRALRDGEIVREGASPESVARVTFILGHFLIPHYERQVDRFEVMEETNHDAMDLYGTLVRAYVLLPLALAWPILVCVALSRYGWTFPDVSRRSPAMVAAIAVLAFYAGYVIMVVLYVLRRARGDRRAGLFAR